MNEDYDFDSYLEEIMNAVYGEEVRGSIRSALEILYGMLQDAESGVIDIRDSAQDAANTAWEHVEQAMGYAAQAMATTPEGYDTFAIAIADVIGEVYITQSEVDYIFTDPGYVNITVPTEPGNASEDPAQGGEGAEEP